MRQLKLFWLTTAVIVKVLVWIHCCILQTSKVISILTSTTRKQGLHMRKSSIVVEWVITSWIVVKIRNATAYLGLQNMVIVGLPD